MIIRYIMYWYIFYLFGWFLGGFVFLSGWGGVFFVLNLNNDLIFWYKLNCLNFKVYYE